jgi:hypothetical protein
MAEPELSLMGAIHAKQHNAILAFVEIKGQLGEEGPVSS